MSTFDAVVVPSTLLLLPAYAGLQDPAPELRSACREVLSWLVQRHPHRVGVVTAGVRPDNVARGVAEPAGVRIARHLLTEASFHGAVVPVTGQGPRPPGVLVVANGSAARSEQAPGHLDDRAMAYDAVVDAALRSGDGGALRGLDPCLGARLWSYDVPALQTLGALTDERVSARVSYADDPFGVQYWVARWSCAS